MKVSHMRLNEMGYTELTLPWEIQSRWKYWLVCSDIAMYESEGLLLVESVESNIGHLEMAAGIAGLIKTILVVRRVFHQTLVLRSWIPMSRRVLHLMTSLWSYQQSRYHWGGHQRRMRVSCWLCQAWGCLDTQEWFHMLWLTRCLRYVEEKSDMIGAGPSSSVFLNHMKLP